MRFLHFQITADAGATVRVDLRGSECDVMLLDDHNFWRYQRRDSFHYFGGHFRRSPAILNVPHDGRWNVVVDPSGGAVEAAVRVL